MRICDNCEARDTPNSTLSIVHVQEVNGQDKGVGTVESELCPDCRSALFARDWRELAERKGQIRRRPKDASAISNST